MGTKIVVVGAGYAGILTAKKLAKKFKKNNDVSITIIDKNPFHTMLTELHEVAANRVDEDSIKISLKKVFAGRKVDVKLDTINSIEFDKKLVNGKNQNYDYDYLVLAAGSKPTDFGISGVKDHAFMLWSYDKITRHTTGTVIWAAGIEGSDITTKVTKQLEGGGRGRVKLDQYLRSVDDEHVYVVGDNMFYICEGEERPVPQVVENAEQSAETAAHNIECVITGQGEMHAYQHKNHGFMVCVGGRYGVASVGLPNHMFKLPSFLAMFAKHFINIVYFIQVLGWNKIFSYIRHEFFTIRNCRSFVGGHFSNRTPSFLLVALRIWLGCVWVFEGVMKIVEGWFTSPMLTAFFGGANAWYNNIVSGGSATGAADGVSAATAEAASQVAESVGTAILNFNFIGLFQVIFVSGKALAESTISDFAFKLNVPLMNWFVDTLIMPSDSVQIFMQGSIVVAEILIGLALIGGLFTFPASALSLILQVMFVCTTGLYLNTFWMIFASIALLIGAGRTFGLDYYVMPYLKKKWKQIPFVRRLYIYND
jgi:NADH:quinone reductase (non-electrogenic)